MLWDMWKVGPHELFDHTGWRGLKYHDAVGEAIDAIEHQAMEMNIEIGRILQSPEYVQAPVSEGQTRPRLTEGKGG